MHSFVKSPVNRFNLIFVLLGALISLQVYALGDGDIYCLYQKKDFQGESICGANDLNQLDQFGKGKSKKGKGIDSIQIKAGYQLEAYSKEDFSGKSTTLIGSNPKLKGKEKNIRSLRVSEIIPPPDDQVCFYKKDNYRGDYLCTEESSPELDRDWDNRISSVKIPVNFTVTLYDKHNYRGKSAALITDAPKLEKKLNNKISSFLIDKIVIDTDGDGVPDDQDAFPNDLNESVDTDGDNVGDNADPDDDNDGVEDTVDAFPLDPTESTDLDGDGIGDNSDPDRDGDGISNDYEIQVGTDPNDANSTPSDIDGDGIPDSLDDDRDGDGVNNDQDIFPDDPNESSDLDGDGIGDNSDSDRDGDGISNDYEVEVVNRDDIQLFVSKDLSLEPEEVGNFIVRMQAPVAAGKGSIEVDVRFATIKEPVIERTVSARFLMPYE